MADLAAPSKLADPTLLEAIDKLFELNIGEYVALPQVKAQYHQNPLERLTTIQLLVVGDQSR